jgi:hypothetical protein
MTWQATSASPAASFKCIPKPRSLSYVASYDVASDNGQALAAGGWSGMDVGVYTMPGGAVGFTKENQDDHFVIPGRDKKNFIAGVRPHHTPLTTPLTPPSNPPHTPLTPPSHSRNTPRTTPSHPPHTPLTPPSHPPHTPLTPPSHPPHRCWTGTGSRARRCPASCGADCARSSSCGQGLTLVQFSAHLERCVWDRGCA